jgi:membrane-associated phospholipid phosphatase
VGAAALYRVGITAPIVLSYFQLRWILPAINSRALDAQIYAFDLRVFHYEPSVAWDKYVTSGTVEWFAFFYFGYFIIVACNVLPFLSLGRDDKPLRQFGTGLVAQFCMTHLLYLVVPGFGPYHELHFDRELVGGPFWALVLQSVHTAGALKDIFPSLHTGAPTFLAVFAFAHRKTAPFKQMWPILAFCVLQIIGATMFLRWHYLIDIIAGFALGTFNALFWGPVIDWEYARRKRLNLSPIFGVAPIPTLLARLRITSRRSA